MAHAGGGLSIGTLSRQCGVHIETIRYYERIGLVPAPDRTAGGHRSYGPPHVQRLEFVRRARDLGFTLDEIRALLGLAESDQPCADARQVAARHLEDVRGKIAALQRMERVLAGMVDLCDGEGRECPLIDALTSRRTDP